MNRLFRLLYYFSQGHPPREVSSYTGIGGYNGESVKGFYMKLHQAILDWMELKGVENLRPIEQAQQENRGVFCWLLSVLAETHPPFKPCSTEETMA